MRVKNEALSELFAERFAQTGKVMGMKELSAQVNVKVWTLQRAIYGRTHDSDCLARVAVTFGLSLEQFKRRLGIGNGKPRKHGRK